VNCHTIHGNTPKLVAKQAPNMCLDCHSGVLQDGSKKAGYVHAPVAGGMCLSCHNPHGTSARHNVVPDIQKVCAGCHKPNAPEMAKAHGAIPVADSDCSSCHDVHSHNKQAKLIKTNQHMPFKSHQCGTCHKPNSTELIKPERQLCTMCHSKDLATDPTDGSQLHGAVKQGMCTGCHNPHASDSKKAYWKDEKLAYACFTCHSSVEYQVTATHRHKPVEGLDCMSCHKPHMSKESKLLVKSEDEICKQCHKEHALMHPMLKKADGKPVIDPIRKGTLTCTSCHTPHGGQFERLAVRDWKRDLCTGCHSGLH
jgi:predicted CXXCH cytochrome family protein